ncbi:MAG: hypothetical protein HZC51_00550 [Nitrospirae bacterium]|nr:hypothetical protein [Nitrospirota bacterium]
MITDHHKSTYSAAALYEAPRLLSLQDRDPASHTYGCFDRNYWQWKFVDFPGSRFQEGAFSLALLYTGGFEGNPYHKKDRVRRWAVAGMRYWAGLLGRDGSLNEAYPNEHSFVATAFSLLSVAEAYSLLRDETEAADSEMILGAMAKAGGWLLKNEETHAFISNHILGAAAALNELYMITGDNRYAVRGKYFVDTVRRRQSGEGWFLEYTGADPGYLTQGIYYMARYWMKTGDVEALESLRSAVGFLSHFVHPDQTLGGEYGSRNTEFYFPAGMEILSDSVPEAAAIAAHMRAGIRDGVSAGLAAMDAYNFMPLFSNYLVAHKELAGRKDVSAAPQALPFQKEGDSAVYFEQARLAVVKKGGYYAVLGAGKGGVLKVYSTVSNRLVHSNCGYKGVLAGGAEVSTQSPGDAAVEHDPACGTFVIKGRFTGGRPRVFTSVGFLAFRLYNLTLCRSPYLARLLKELIVKALIFKRGEFPAVYRRRVSFRDDRVDVDDEILADGKIEFESLSLLDKFTALHMGSSKYFQVRELDAEELPGGLGAQDAGPGVKFERSISVMAGR